MENLEIVPLQPKHWQAFEQLFGPRGACAGCWCMFWKLEHKAYDTGRGDPNRRAHQQLVETGVTTGLLAFVDGIPAGWIAIAPRSHYPGLARSRVLAPLDDLPVWSVPCFFVERNFRGRGLTVELLKAAVAYAAAQGAGVVEGYPVEPKTAKAPPAFVFTGLVSAFLQAGFSEAGRRSETRPIMRFVIRS